MMDEHTIYQRLLDVATSTAMKRKEMAAQVLALMMRNDPEGVLTQQEIQEVISEALRHDWIELRGDGTFSLTQAGQRAISPFSAPTEHIDRVPAHERSSN